MLRRELFWTGVKLRPMVLLLLALPLATMLAVRARSSQGLPPPGDGTCLSKPPTLSVVNPSVVVNEGQVATNRGAYDDSIDPCEGDIVRISASVGTVTYPIQTEQGTWNWSYPAPEVSADQTRTVTIRATDTTGGYSSRSFSLTVRNLTTANDNFAQAQEISGVPGPGVDQWATVTGNSEKATTESGEPLTPTWGTMFPWPFISGGHLSGIDCAVFSSYNSVWYKVTPQKDGWLYLSTEGSTFDTVLGLYEGRP
jgi:hypothetical protein